MTAERHEPQQEVSEEEELKWPLGFITVLVLAAIYLVWRFAQLGIRFFEWVF